MPVLRILVDAAGLYSATLVTALVCFANGKHIMKIIFIALYVVLIRITMREEHVTSDLDHVEGDGRYRLPGDKLWAETITSAYIAILKNDFIPPPEDIERNPQPLIQKGESSNATHDL
ncbi:hypothetical protein V8E55_007400 [Tylopilus felleus]